MQINCIFHNEALITRMYIWLRVYIYLDCLHVFCGMQETDICSGSSAIIHEDVQTIML